MFGCFRKMGCLFLLLVLVGVAWWYRGAIREKWNHLSGAPAPTTVSEGTARTAERRLDSLAQGRVARASFHSAEIQSLLQYRHGSDFPPVIADRTIRIEDGVAVISFRVPSDKLPDLAGMNGVRDFLPDTADVEVRGRLLSYRNGTTGIDVVSMKVQHIPAPQRLIPRVVGLLGGKSAAGLPPSAFLLDWPRGVASGYLSGDSLVLTRSAVH